MCRLLDPFQYFYHYPSSLCPQVPVAIAPRDPAMRRSAANPRMMRAIGSSFFSRPFPLPPSLAPRFAFNDAYSRPRERKGGGNAHMSHPQNGYYELLICYMVKCMCSNTRSLKKQFLAISVTFGDGLRHHANVISARPLMEGQGARQAPSPCSFQCSFTFFLPPFLPFFLRIQGETRQGKHWKQHFRNNFFEVDWQYWHWQQRGSHYHSIQTLFSQSTISRGA